MREVRRQSDTSGDPSAVFTARQAGEYTVKVCDAGFAGGPHFVYRLTLQSGPRLETIFPLGGRRGETERRRPGMTEGMTGREHGDQPLRARILEGKI